MVISEVYLSTANGSADLTNVNVFKYNVFLYIYIYIYILYMCRPILNLPNKKDECPLGN